jgi:hypothetical protein
LFFLGWRRRALQEEELRSKQADAVGTECDRLLRVGRATNVRFDMDAVPVERRCRLERVGLLDAALPGLRFLLLVDAGDVSGRRIDPQCAPRAIENDE